jgi:hypothetical protein
MLLSRKSKCAYKVKMDMPTDGDDLFYLANCGELLWCFWKSITFDRHSIVLETLLAFDPAEEQIGEFCLENANLATSSSDTLVARDVDIARTEPFKPNGVLNDLFGDEVTDAEQCQLWPTVPTTGVAECDMTRIVVKNHRRIHQTAPYIKHVVAVCRIKFGTCVDTSVNRLAIRRTASSEMKAHGVRPTDMARQLDTVVAMVLTPTDEAIFAEGMINSTARKERLSGMSGRGWWSRWFGTNDSRQVA